MTIRIRYSNGGAKLSSNGFSLGSFLEDAAKHCNGNVDRRIANKDASTTRTIYTTQNHASNIYSRNTSCWIYDLAQQLTAVSPWNSYGAETRSGTLISPRHVILAAHYFYPVGTTVRFVDINNNVISRTVSTVTLHPSYSSYYPDIAIAKLDSDVPESISFVKILPSNWSSYFPGISSSKPVACFGLDREEKANVRHWTGVGSNYTTFTSPPIGTKRYEFYENLVGGDSGDPAFIIIDNQLVLLSTWTYSSGLSTSLTAHTAAINTIMTNQGGGYQLTTVDLSNFKTY